MKEIKLTYKDSSFDVTLELNEIKDLLVNDVAYMTVIFSDKECSNSDWLYIELVINQNTEFAMVFSGSTNESENFEFLKHFAGFKNVNFSTEPSNGEIKINAIRFALFGEKFKDGDRIKNLEKYKWITINEKEQIIETPFDNEVPL